MSSEIRVPTLGESVTEATIAQWYKKPGDAVAIDEPLCELETDKVTIEVPAQSAGVLAEVTVAEGETVEVGALLGSIGEGTRKENATENTASPPETAPAASAEPTPAPIGHASALSPSARRVVEEPGPDPAPITGTGQDGRSTKHNAMPAAPAPAQPPAPDT